MKQPSCQWADFYEILYLSIFRKSAENSQVSFKKMTRMTGTLHKDLCKILIISRLPLRRVRNVSDKPCRENQNTLFIFENRAVYEIVWKHTIQPDRT